MKEAISLLMDSIVTGIISVTAAYCIYYIKQATQKIKADIAARSDCKQKELFDAAADRVSSLAEITVAAIEQTMAGTLRQAVKEGKTDRQLLLDLGTEAVLQVKEQLAEAYKNVIMAECGDIDTYISNAVEAKVYELKHKQKQGA